MHCKNNCADKLIARTIVTGVLLLSTKIGVSFHAPERDWLVEMEFEADESWSERRKRERAIW